jgi:membrane glycosyltransferase
VAVSMDSVASKQAPVPPFSLLDMPAQPLDRYRRKRRPSRPRLKTRLARLVTFAGAAALTAYACREMIAVVAVGGITTLQGAMVVLFTLAFAWIALSASAALAGVLFGGVRRRARDDAPIDRSTALVMPICNEDPARSFAALEAMAMGLIEQGTAAGFEIFVLSDTTNADTYVQETAAFLELRETLGDRLRIWYRHRAENVQRKAGNLRDFITRWGGRYHFMIVLDADSILAPDTLVTLVREMAADPRLGLLQTVPRLSGAETLFGRLQQFAGVVYGPIVARGIAAWQGDDGNYWGHNAIIRVRAFAAAAGLPDLPGRRPFGGTILSHDFVEAALLRRAGWSVRMLPTLAGSWEEAPPSLLDVAARDRRWAQGNIQHLAVIRAAGFTWGSRAHLLLGVLSYLASPLWLLLIVTGLAVTVQIASAQFQYFTDERSLFPVWPRFDSERMLDLFVFSMIVLLTPKVLGFCRALADRELRKVVGATRLAIGLVTETLLSALYAPISMMIQTRQVAEIFGGLDSGWAVQNRKRSAVPLRLLLKRHWLHTLLGAAVAYELTVMSPTLLPWMAPALLGLVLALPLSAASASVVLGKLAHFLGFLVTPEEEVVPAVIRRRDAFETALASRLASQTVERLLGDEQARLRHLATVLPRPPAPRGKPDLVMAGARAKLAEARTAEEALAWLTPAERIAVLGDHDALHALAGLARTDRAADLPAVKSA